MERQQITNLANRVWKRLQRIVEAPPVKERTVVRVINASEDNHQCKSGFLIGVYRSGTTLLRYILDSHPNVAVPPETNFMHTVSELWTSEWNRKGLGGVGVDEKALQFRLRSFTQGILDDYARAKGKTTWIDKTPSYIDILEVINKIWGPEIRFIMLYRHGLDVAHSLSIVHEANQLAGPARRYVELYKESPRLAFVQYWVDQCEKMLAFEEMYPYKCYRICYEQFSSEPKKYLPPLFEFLGEPWDEGVLKFANKSHDFGLQDHKILEISKFMPSIQNYKNWHKEELSEAYKIASPVLVKLGYTV